MYNNYIIESSLFIIIKLLKFYLSAHKGAREAGGDKSCHSGRCAAQGARLDHAQKDFQG